METAVRENEHVLIVCTPKYKENSTHRGGGDEGDIMTAEVLNGQNALDLSCSSGRASGGEAGTVVARRTGSTSISAAIPFEDA